MEYSKQIRFLHTLPNTSLLFSPNLWYDGRVCLGAKLLEHLRTKRRTNMKIAWNEIKYQPKKFILIELLITILMFMVVFLSGLTNGLGRSVSAQIDNYGTLHYILSTDSEGIIPFSTITAKDLDEINKIEEMDYSGLSIQRATISKSEDSNTLDITYFATEHNEEEILNPIMEDSDLKISDLKKNEVILDSSFKKDEGIQVGDQVIDKTSKQKLKVVAFAKNAKYGYSEIGFINSETYTGMRQKTDPSYQWQAQTLVTKNSITSSDLASNLMVADKKQVIDKIPGYKAQNLTLRMITWVLLLASSAILGVFFYILTLQKLKQFGVLKAIGMSMSQITYVQLSQLTIISLIGVLLGLGLATMMAPFLPNSVPSFMTLKDNLTISISFILTSMLCGALSLVKIKKVDPIEVIGGNGE